MTNIETAEDIKSRLVVVDDKKLTLEFFNLQSLYRAADALEDRGREYFVVKK